VLGRLEDEREIWQQADEETIRRWELLRARYLEYCRGVPRLEEGMRKAAPEYWPDRRDGARARDGGDRRRGRRPHAGALEAARGEARDALASLSNDELDELET
jgi:hypothetical protein